jgi:hypothetical protein
MKKKRLEGGNGYLPSEWEYGDFLEACRVNLYEFPFVTWDSVTDEDINEWISMLDDALKLADRQ